LITALDSVTLSLLGAIVILNLTVLIRHERVLTRIEERLKRLEEAWLR